MSNEIEPKKKVERPPIPNGMVRVFKKLNRAGMPEAWLDLDASQTKLIERYKAKAENPHSRISKVVTPKG